MPPTLELFEPALYSLAELSFMLDWLGKPPIAALHKGVPKGVNPDAIRECLGRLYEFAEMERHQSVGWAGVDSIKDSIVRYIAWSERTAEIHRRGGPRHASQFLWDERGKTYKFGVGADSAEMVRSEILTDGSHRPFAVNLRMPYGESLPNVAEVAPWLKTLPTAPEKPDALMVDRDHGLLQCPICMKTIEFKPDSQRSYAMARAGMARHLRAANQKIERHQLLLRKEFK